MYVDDINRAYAMFMYILGALYEKKTVCKKICKEKYC